MGSGMSLAAVRGCAVIQSGLAGMSEMVLRCTTEAVESPLGNLVCLEEQR